MVAPLSKGPFIRELQTTAGVIPGDIEAGRAVLNTADGIIYVGYGGNTNIDLYGSISLPAPSAGQAWRAYPWNALTQVLDTADAKPTSLFKGQEAVNYIDSLQFIGTGEDESYDVQGNQITPTPNTAGKGWREISLSQNSAAREWTLNEYPVTTAITIPDANNVNRIDVVNFGTDGTLNDRNSWTRNWNSKGAATIPASMVSSSIRAPMPNDTLEGPIAIDPSGNTLLVREWTLATTDPYISNGHIITPRKWRVDETATTAAFTIPAGANRKAIANFGQDAAALVFFPFSRQYGTDTAVTIPLTTASFTDTAVAPGGRETFGKSCTITPDVGGGTNTVYSAWLSLATADTAPLPVSAGVGLAEEGGIEFEIVPLTLLPTIAATAPTSTEDTTPTITGDAAQPNETVEVFIDGISVGTTTADAAGVWAFTPGTALAVGSYSVTVRQGTGGVQSAAGTPLTMVVVLGVEDPAVSAPTIVSQDTTDPSLFTISWDITMSASGGAAAQLDVELLDDQGDITAQADGINLVAISPPDVTEASPQSFTTGIGLGQVVTVTYTNISMVTGGNRARRPVIRATAS